jgi:hypothetical protein
VVAPQGLPRFVGLSQAIDSLIPNAPPGVSEWDYFDLNEMEALPTLFRGNLDFGGLIAEKKGNPFGRSRCLINYLDYKDHSILLKEDRTEEKFQRELKEDSRWKEIMQRIKAWGLSEGW